METTVVLDRLDEHFLGLDREAEPWNVHFEVHVAGRLDAERLAGAIAAAMQRHPIARASLSDWRGYERRYHWRIADAPAVPLAVANCADEQELDIAREALLRVSPGLAAPPPFAVLLAHTADGDALVLSLHHAAGDGIAAARLMRSILLAYAGEDDPAPPVDPLTARDVQALAGATTRAERRMRWRALVRQAAARVIPPARLARRGGRDHAGYGVVHTALTREETRALDTARPAGATINDFLLGALAVTARRWNAAYGRRVAPIALTMPVNLRPEEWRDEVVGNFASYVSVVVGASARDVRRATESVARQTRAIKRDRLAGTVVDLLDAPSMQMIAVKRRMADLIPLTGDVVVDTASLSNLGVLEPLPGDVRAVWFSPPGRMPLGAAIGVVAHGGSLHLTLRYRHAQFDRAAARQFLALFRGVLAWPTDA
ncbi:condensation domain-containing protein [Solirubrobacter ginsenosidimutans]|uniref:Condensation domain-containing protein n=1 Tax=Solirubrobacter ginsenosidimutans TaxID=490573 RepID=A0A9X3S376_9ACTN|nr:condensation domain-containing protein [Solirubrobacter ginsenosidimutans]MDA0164339.1 condensation domain-containing protein [Solirubrobacter ginsenosidimutans]